MDDYRTGPGQHSWVAAGAQPRDWLRPSTLVLTPVYAGFRRRFLASAIDWILIGFVAGLFDSLAVSILSGVAEIGGGIESEELAFTLWFACFIAFPLVLDWLYYAVLESSSWQGTIGKRALGIVVTDLAGRRISFGRATGRYLAHILSIITLGVGYLIQRFTQRRQALHDIVAGTLVVRV